MTREEIIFRKGEMGTELFIVMHGKVLVVDDYDGELNALARLEPGDCFGEMALFTRVRRSATVVCVEDGMLLVLDEAKLRHFIEKKISAKFLVNLIAILASRLRHTNAHYMKAQYGEDAAWVMGAPTHEQAEHFDRRWIG